MITPTSAPVFGSLGSIPEVPEPVASDAEQPKSSANSGTGLGGVKPLYYPTVAVRNGPTPFTLDPMSKDQKVPGAMQQVNTPAASFKFEPTPKPEPAKGLPDFHYQPPPGTPAPKSIFFGNNGATNTQDQLAVKHDNPFAKFADPNATGQRPVNNVNFSSTPVRPPRPDGSSVVSDGTQQVAPRPMAKAVSRNKRGQAAQRSTTKAPAPAASTAPVAASVAASVAAPFAASVAAPLAASVAAPVAAPFAAPARFTMPPIGEKLSFLHDIPEMQPAPKLTRQDPLALFTETKPLVLKAETKPFLLPADPPAQKSTEPDKVFKNVPEARVGMKPAVPVKESSESSKPAKTVPAPISLNPEAPSQPKAPTPTQTANSASEPKHEAKYGLLGANKTVPIPPPDELLGRVGKITDDHPDYQRPNTGTIEDPDDLLSQLDIFKEKIKAAGKAEKPKPEEPTPEEVEVDHQPDSLFNDREDNKSEDRPADDLDSSSVDEVYEEHPASKAPTGVQNPSITEMSAEDSYDSDSSSESMVVVTGDEPVKKGTVDKSNLDPTISGKFIDFSDYSLD